MHNGNVHLTHDLPYYGEILVGMAFGPLVRRLIATQKQLERT
jgi:hypothetical protein